MRLLRRAMSWVLCLVLRWLGNCNREAKRGENIEELFDFYLESVEVNLVYSDLI